MADALTDQAEGLRRLRVAHLPGLCTVLSADRDDSKQQWMRKLATSMLRRGRAVLWVDATTDVAGARTTLFDVASGTATLADAACVTTDGVQRIRLGTDRDDAGVCALLRQLAQEQMRVLVDAQLDDAGQLPLSLLADGELVVQLSATSESIRCAYQMLHALKDLRGRGSVSLLVTDADPARANKACANLFHAASRYLALPLRSIIPQEIRHV